MSNSRLLFIYNIVIYNKLLPKFVGIIVEVENPYVLRERCRVSCLHRLVAGFMFGLGIRDEQKTLTHDTRTPLGSYRFLQLVGNKLFPIVSVLLTVYN